MPWANGGGSTRQVAIEPPDGSLAAGFTWRVSCARVDSDGPFSHLPGVDRSLWLRRGAGVRLAMPHGEVVLAVPFARYDFAGELAVHCTRLDGVCEDVNVMTNRARCRSEARIAAVHAGSVVVVPAAPQWLVLVLDGIVSVPTADPSAPPIALANGAALRGRGLVPHLVARTHASVLVAGFRPVGEHACSA
ncbi:MAG: HutD family protein [Planctomycetes bacterium]|nr:HutD family protein [Planctomycetota bacterium]